jgi:hypothetical protein
MFTTEEQCSFVRILLAKGLNAKDIHKEVAETTVKRLLCCGFRRTAKAIGQIYQC